jgi:hypothetical protein
MAGQKRSSTGRCRGCNHPERVRIERFLAAGASIRERPGSWRSTITRCVGTGGTTFRLKPAPPMSRELERAKLEGAKPTAEAIASSAQGDPYLSTPL